MRRIHRFMNHSFIRYITVGIVNTTVGLSATLAIFNVLGGSYWAATFTGNVLGAIVSYLLNRSFTFRSRLPISGSLLRFAVIALVCYSFSYPVSLFLGMRLTAPLRLYGGHYAHNIAILTGNVLYTALGYFGHRHLTFAVKKGGSSYETDIF